MYREREGLNHEMRRTSCQQKIEAHELHCEKREHDTLNQTVTFPQILGASAILVGLRMASTFRKPDHHRERTRCPRLPQHNYKTRNHHAQTYFSNLDRLPHKNHEFSSLSGDCKIILCGGRNGIEGGERRTSHSRPRSHCAIFYRRPPAFSSQTTSARKKRHTSMMTEQIYMPRRTKS
ncbi:hypothetical protein BU24DRAFT_169706 [Aaosphaeria arxii CBS 175.79]|uniref:Uncharacterized protein n=1 Tax=Aaosphaeria arxii CBS 175.79 TaxID=1450172 RepID=A0A6A5Y1E4_9PLEO|nr:uncharacterized protein BU24DRAFT_169706 [Aaosphaeria arxii CBS 175.79]KAF2018384.1 hypothetical protein BU24DRAFT_169706 [Aaosphaeria arxii CBS 175.79]